MFLSHSSRDNRAAVAVKQWLIEHEPSLAEEIFLDLDPHTGIRPGERWKEALNQANTRRVAVICLLSKHCLRRVKNDWFLTIILKQIRRGQQHYFRV